MNPEEMHMMQSEETRPEEMYMMQGEENRPTDMPMAGEMGKSESESRANGIRVAGFMLPKWLVVVLVIVAAYLVYNAMTGGSVKADVAKATSAITDSGKKVVSLASNLLSTTSDEPLPPPQ